ncbi:hypothetical protein RQP46_002362 [Phenoliferia psychrophenolica]
MADEDVMPFSFQSLAVPLATTPSPPQPESPPPAAAAAVAGFAKRVTLSDVAKGKRPRKESYREDDDDDEYEDKPAPKRRAHSPYLNNKDDDYDDSDVVSLPAPVARGPPTARAPPKPSVVATKPEFKKTHHSYTLQRTTCNARALTQHSFPKCHVCTTRLVPGCAFRNVRSFSTALDGTLLSPAFISHSSLTPPEQPLFPTVFNEPFTPSHAALLKSLSAHTLVPTLLLERTHAQLPSTLRVPEELGVRSTCDACLHSVLSGSWLCTTCGRELCFACVAHVDELETRDAGEADGEVAQKRYSEQEWRLRKCKGRKGTKEGVHGKGKMVPLTRFAEGEVERLVDRMQDWLEQHPYERPEPVEEDVLEGMYQAPPYDDPDQSHPYLRPQALSPLVMHDDFPSSSSSTLPPPSPPAPSTDLALDKLFHSLWARGETMLVDVADGERAVLDWSPEYFAREFGDVKCKVASNRSGIEKDSTVGEFFGSFGRTRDDQDIWKIKDWPSATDFKEDFPTLFEDYMRALPVGHVTRRDGVLNIAAHTPTNANPPDLGPKGYFSQVSDDKEGGQGSTKLHNAVNLMLWAGDAPDGTPGRAAWDLFRASDSELIREFLYEIIAEREQRSDTPAELRKTLDDPIHGQNVYLDETLRARLLAEKGVKSWRIWQVPGQVVFIPAGCAHQVCNFADCIKIASDFVSIENVVTDEFREQTKEGAPWRSDVLQLKSQLLWAWKSCERFDEPPELEAAVPASAPAS